MKIINNISDIMADDLRQTISEGSRLSFAASCFSIYAFEELKKELENIDALRFIFTSPTFVAEKSSKEIKRVLYPSFRAVEEIKKLKGGL